MITNGFTYVAVLLFMAGVLVTLEKTAKGIYGTLVRNGAYIPCKTCRCIVMSTLTDSRCNRILI